MKVVNVAGFPVKFEKNGRIFVIPSDNQLHPIPDECFYQDNFQGLLRVIVPPIQVKQVIKKMSTPTKMVDMNDPSIKEIIIDEVEKKNNKPLAGKKIKKSKRNELKKTRPNGKKKILVPEEENKKEE